MIRLVTRPRPQNESPARGGAEAGLEGMIEIRAKGVTRTIDGSHIFVTLA